MKVLIPLFIKLLSIISPKSAANLALKLFSHPRRNKRCDDEMKYLSTGKQVTFKSQRKARTWGKGPVIWVLHGWESRGSTFYKLIPLLIEKGYRVVAWDGPAHGDSPGKVSNVVDHPRALAVDMNEELFAEPVAMIGHSFGGAAFAIFSKIHKLPAKTVIISAPTRINGVFNRFFKMIKLGKKSQDIFTFQSEEKTGYKLSEISLVDNDFSQLSDTLVIHDKGDDIIPYDDFIALKNTWQSGQFITTENLGHRKTIKEENILKKILNFIN
jgi:esterase/lipase